MEYGLSYTYDAGGNRLTKTDNHSVRVTTYHYDIETPDNLDGGQHNNRLLSIDVEDTDPASGTMNLVEQTIYRYGPAGNVTRLIKRFDSDGFGGLNDDDFFADVWWFYYDTGNHLWLAVRGTGEYDAVAGVLVPGSTLFNTAAEYHYDGGRQRYLVRQRNPNPSDPNDPNSPRWTIIGTGQWRDYLGNSIYNDYTVDQAGTVTNGRGYIPGIGFDDPSLASSPAYLGTDLIGTTRRITGSPGGTPPGGTPAGGTGVSPVIFTIASALE